jgi:vacuolar-type H+-ATPase subunit C/Vma6
MFADMVLYAGKTKDDNIKDFVSLKADTENLLTAVKCRIAGLPPAEFERQFLTGGNINKRDYLSFITASAESGTESLRGTRISAMAQKGLKDFAAQGIAPLEREADNMLTLYFRDKKDMQDTAYPLINYYQTKLAEIKNINIIFTCKTGGASPSDIRTRLRAL